MDLPAQNAGKSFFIEKTEKFEKKRGNGFADEKKCLNLGFVI
jgi:hypothetical protein